MQKRYNNLYDKICNMENLKLAHKNARKGKGWYKEVQEVDENLDYYLHKLQNMLVLHTYKTSEYTMFKKKEGGKIRTIYKLPYFPDRICQWAILQVIEHCLINHFISDTFSSIPNRGLIYGLKRVQKAVYNDKENCMYCLKFDIRHYYQSINHKILKTKYSNMFKDKELLSLLYEITDSINTAEWDDLNRIYPSGNQDVNTGIPIGNYLSQYSGNYYLSDFDHWLKEEKHVKYYYRNMDDCVILSQSKEFLHSLLNEIKDYLYLNLRLTLKQNYQVFPTYVRGIDFLGYRIFNNFTLLRKTTCENMKYKLLYLKDIVKHNLKLTIHDIGCLSAYNGLVKWCNGFRLHTKYLKDLINYKGRQLAW
jgi:hypothetical protein